METETLNLIAFGFAFAVIWFVDGIKVIIESCCGAKNIKYYGDHDQVTVIVAAYNEERVILKTIESLLRIVPAENIIIVDDGSKDRTSEIVRNHNSKIVLLTIANRGKVGAIHYALSQVKTPYVLLMDADIILEPDFVIPTEALEKKLATAVSFNIIPTVAGKSFFNRLWRNFQAHEYAKSMQIGRRFSNHTKSVHCVSGAAGLFCTDRLKELAKKHTMIFTGEDLERTLLELTADGEVIFSESTVYTDAPQDFKQLTKQRVIGWWPGLWRNVGMFLKIIFQKNRPFRLRYELIYEIFALATNPLKIISLCSMIFFNQWLLIIFIFGTYTWLEAFISYKIGKLNGNYLEMEILILLLFTLYSLYQMFCVTFAFFVFVYKKFLTNDWNKAVATCALFLSVSFATQAQEKKKDWSVDYQHSYISDIEKNRTFQNDQVYLGYKNIYTMVTTAPYNAVSIGGYFHSFIATARYQWKSEGLSAKVRYEHWFGSFVPHIFVGYGVPELSINKSSFPTSGIGLNYYFDDKSNIDIEVSKEFGREYGLTYAAKAKIIKKSFWSTFGASINNFGHAGTFALVGYKFIYINADYYQHFDFNNFNRASVGLGLKLEF